MLFARIECTIFGILFEIKKNIISPFENEIETHFNTNQTKKEKKNYIFRRLLFRNQSFRCNFPSIDEVALWCTKKLHHK